MSASSTAPDARPKVQLCSLVSEASGEDLIGSAWSTARYIATEFPLPWPYDVMGSNHAPAGLKDFIYGLYAKGIYWGFLAIAPDPDIAVEGHTRVLIFDQKPAPSTGYSCREYLIPADRLVELMSIFVDDETNAAVEACRVDRPDDQRDFFVCTHGAIDACCAKFGYPVYRELKKIAAESGTNTRLWRCTHFGGHRFAATLLEMPSGRYWGRLKGPHLSGLINHDLPTSEMRKAYRGWAMLSHTLAQVAEGEAFRRGGWAWTECDVAATGVPEDEEAIAGTITLSYRHPRGEEGAITIEVIPNGTIATMGSSTSDEMHDAQQFRCEIRSVSPAGGILDRDPDPPAI
ncbi:MAG: sucrase ferredoxin [Thermomicrobiales bacterium]